MNCELLPENQLCNDFGRKEVELSAQIPSTDSRSSSCRNCECSRHLIDLSKSSQSFEADLRAVSFFIWPSLRFSWFSDNCFGQLSNLKYSIPSSLKVEDSFRTLLIPLPGSVLTAWESGSIKKGLCWANILINHKIWELPAGDFSPNWPAIRLIRISIYKSHIGGTWASLGTFDWREWTLLHDGLIEIGSAIERKYSFVDSENQ